MRRLKTWNAVMRLTFLLILCSHTAFAASLNQHASPSEATPNTAASTPETPSQAAPIDWATDLEAAVIATPSNLPEVLQDEEPDIVYNEIELAAWLTQHKETGGEVALGTSITITNPIPLYNIQKEITINTGHYGFVFNGSSLPATNILITGEGVDVPVVDVIQASSDSPWEYSWNNNLLDLTITATGRDGEGGTALRILETDSKKLSMDGLYEQGIIRSYGTGAIGLWLAAPTDASCYRVEVFGKNSMAVYAPSGAVLTYCKLTAEGDDASAVSGTDIVLDSCAVSPTPTGIQIINRYAMEESFTRLYLPLKQNGSELNGIYMLNTPNVFLNDGSEVISRSFVVEWDMDIYHAIDNTVLGTTLVPGSVAAPLYDLGIFDDISIQLAVEVRDPALPCISNLFVRELDDQQYARLNLWHTYDPLDEQVILWRSDDEGQTWWKANESPELKWYGDSIDFYYDVLEHPVWFQIEVIGIGESNIAVLDARDGVFIGGNGGDRTGTDREGAKPSDNNGNGSLGSSNELNSSNNNSSDGNSELHGNESSSAAGNNELNSNDNSPSDSGDKLHSDSDSLDGEHQSYRSNSNTQESNTHTSPLRSDQLLSDTNRNSLPENALANTTDQARDRKWTKDFSQAAPGNVTPANPKMDEPLIPTDSTEASLTIENQQTATITVLEEALKTSVLPHQPLDQSASPPGKPLQSLTVFFLSTAAFSIAALLCLHFVSRRR